MSCKEYKFGTWGGGGGLRRLVNGSRNKPLFHKFSFLVLRMLIFNEVFHAYSRVLYKSLISASIVYRLIQTLDLCLLPCRGEGLPNALV